MTVREVHDHLQREKKNHLLAVKRIDQMVAKLLRAARAEEERARGECPRKQPA